MAYEATNWAWNVQGLTASQKFVLIALADRADEAFSCYPGQSSLAAMVSASEDTVSRSIARLEKVGLLTRQPRYGANGKRTSDRYHLNVHARVPDSLARKVRVSGGTTPQPQGDQPANATFAPSINHQLITSGDFEGSEGKTAPDPFDEFWNAYPIKKGKEPARSAFKKALKAAPVEEIMAGVHRYSRSLKPDSKIKYPQGWLNDCRWLDEYETDKPKVADDDWMQPR